MGCSTSGEKVAGCGSEGGCSSSGCNKSNVYDWFSFMPHSPFENFNIIEVSFKNGARKGFYRNNNQLELFKGQLIVVEAAQGFDIGEVSLQGELVRAQMKKKKVTERDDTIRSVIRIANDEDVNIFLDGRNKERETMIRARAIAKSMNIEMKIGDVEYQGDGKKLTIYYISDGRVDFRELVKVYVRDFKTKIEMRQIGARQEAGRIGGIGSCGRELCCSTWLQDFKSVTTQTVRYQNLSINTEKMSGQCGRLKCCLNYELDTYADSLKKFPKNADIIDTAEGRAILRKTEILKQLMWYSLESNMGVYFKLNIESVQELLMMNKQGQKPANLTNFAVTEDVKEDESKHEDLVGHVSLNSLEERSRRNRNQHQQKRKPNNPNNVSNRQEKQVDSKANNSSLVQDSNEKQSESKQGQVAKNRNKFKKKYPPRDGGSDNKNNA
jgi:cell fate regulator YaaT (PSP1 superfamily)